MRQAKTAILPAALIALSMSVSAAHSESQKLGQVMLFGSNFCPRGWAETDGQLLPISANQALFALFGTNFGGDGRTTFGLPKLPKSKNHWIRYCVALTGTFPSRP